MNYYAQESDRLTYRKLTIKDIPMWHSFFENNDRLHFLGINSDKSDETNAKEWIEKQIERYENDQFGLLAVIEKKTSEFIGMSGIIPRELDGKNYFEIAYSLKPKYWSKGFGTEMAQEMMRFGKQNINTNQFISIIHENNIFSTNVAKKNGMELLFKSSYLGMNVDVYNVHIKK